MQNVGSAQQVRPVVVGVDGSRTGPATVELAAREAERRQAPLRIVHVWPGRYIGVFRSRGLVPSRADGQHVLEISASRARLTAPRLPITTEMLDGGAAPVLTECSERARLLVVGHRDDVVTRPSWGPTTAYLAHHSACPLLVHRGTVPREGPVVVAVSARSPATATLGYAFEQAALTDTRLVAVHMWTRPEAGNRPVGAAAYGSERREAERVLAEALQAWSTQFPDVHVDRLVVHDLEMAYMIERASRRGRLLVAGIGRTGRFAELLYGSLGPGGARHATCPVLLVPPEWPIPVQVPTNSGAMTEDSC